MGSGREAVTFQKRLTYSLLFPKSFTADSKVGLSLGQLTVLVAFPGGPVVKNSLANAGDTGSGRSPGEGNGNPLQYSCLENPMDRGA